MSWFDVPATQIYIFALFVSAEVLFKTAMYIEYKKRNVQHNYKGKYNTEGFYFGQKSHFMATF